MKHILLAVFSVMTVPLLQANPIQATFVGVNGLIDFGYYVGPYYGRLDRQSVVLNCVDFANDVSFGQQWAVNLSHINTQTDLANTRFGNRPDALQLYQEAAWLTLQYALNPSSAYGDIQATIWQLFDRYAPTPSSGEWLSRAQANYSSRTYQDFFVVTNVPPVNPIGQVQEFLTVVDPSMSIYPVTAADINAGPLVPTQPTPEPQLMGALGLALITTVTVMRKIYRRPRNVPPAG